MRAVYIRYAGPTATQGARWIVRDAYAAYSGRIIPIDSSLSRSNDMRRALEEWARWNRLRLVEVHFASTPQGGVAVVRTEEERP